MKNLKIIFGLIIISFVGCTITEKVHFNNDDSGYVEYIIDYSTYVDMAGSSMDIDIDSIMEATLEGYKYNSIEGISDFKFSNDKNSNELYISYNFKNITALNKVIQETSELAYGVDKDKTSETKVKKEFIRKGKKLIYLSPKMEKDSTTESMEGISEFFNYNLIISFDKEIQKVKNENAIISGDRKSVTIKGNLFEILSKDYDSDVTIITK